MCLPAASTDGLALTAVLHDWAGANVPDGLASWTVTSEMNMFAAIDGGATFCCTSLPSTWMNRDAVNTNGLSIGDLKADMGGVLQVALRSQLSCMTGQCRWC